MWRGYHTRVTVPFAAPGHLKAGPKVPPGADHHTLYASEVPFKIICLINIHWSSMRITIQSLPLWKRINFYPATTLVPIANSFDYKQQSWTHGIYERVIGYFKCMWILRPSFFTRLMLNGFRYSSPVASFRYLAAHTASEYTAHLFCCANHIFRMAYIYIYIHKEMKAAEKVLRIYRWL